MKHPLISDALAFVATASAATTWSLVDKVDVLLRILVSLIGIVAGIAALRRKRK